MSIRDPRVDAYIDKAADFAKPVLTHIRKLVHTACPDVVETIKWGMPHFERQGMLCGMAAFKRHCALGFWKRKLIFPKTRGSARGDEAMGQFGRITTISDLPANKVLIGYIKRAVKLNEAGVKAPEKPKSDAKKLVIPADLAAALRKHKKARLIFDGFSYSHKKEYVEWITEAKRDETRARRLATTLEWLSKGKSRNWKYERC